MIEADPRFGAIVVTGSRYATSPVLKSDHFTLRLTERLGRES